MDTHHTFADLSLSLSSEWHVQQEIAKELEQERRRAEQEAARLEAERQAALLEKERIARFADENQKNQQQMVSVGFIFNSFSATFGLLLFQCHH